MKRLTATSSHTPSQAEADPDRLTPSDRDKTPPSPNRGVRNTRRAIIDWIEYTIPALDPLEHLIDLGLENDLTELQGGLGYGSSKAHSCGARIYYNGREDMGTHIKFSGGALRAYSHSVYNVIAAAHIAGATYTRIDLALDLQSDAFTIDHLYEKFRAGLVSMLWHSCDLRESYGRDTKLQGRTLYMGSRESNVFFRFYDKGLESKKPEFKETERLELEFKKTAADIIGKQLEKGVMPQDQILSTLRKYLQVKEKKAGKNRSRWPPCPIYEQLLGDAERIKLTEPDEPLTIERAKEIYWRQSAGLAHVIAEYDGNTAFLDAARSGAGYRLSAKHKALLEQKNKEMNN